MLQTKEGIVKERKISKQVTTIKKILKAVLRAAATIRMMINGPLQAIIKMSKRVVKRRNTKRKQNRTKNTVECLLLTVAKNQLEDIKMCKEIRANLL
jgi:hypothetical protein